MAKDLRDRIIVAASAAKIAGFDETYLALLDLLKTMKLAASDAGSSLKKSSYTITDELVISSCLPFVNHSSQ